MLDRFFSLAFVENIDASAECFGKFIAGLVRPFSFTFAIQDAVDPLRALPGSSGPRDAPLHPLRARLSAPGLRP